MEVNGHFRCQGQFTPKERADCTQSIGHWVCSRDGLDAAEKRSILAPRASMEQNMGRNSSVSIVTHYRLDGPEIESLWGRDFPHPSKRALGPNEVIVGSSFYVNMETFHCIEMKALLLVT
jgi:hypothetical protein